MKIFRVILIVGICTGFSCYAYGAEALVTDLQGEIKAQSKVSKRVKVFLRGVVNIVTLPLEVPRTFVEERKRNPENWEWSVMPRTLENVVGRGLSAVNDSVFLAFLKNPDEVSEPWTRQWELPDYPWKKNEIFEKKDKLKEHDYFTMIGVRG